MDIEQEYIKDIDSLAPSPEIALDVLSIAHESECSIPRLAAKIEKDPNLTANMLRMANSAYFGHMKEINSITDVIVRLGLESVKLIAITSASVGLLKSPQDAYSLETGRLWEHSYATAILASIIARYAKAKDGPGIYTAALLHDVGKVLLNRPLQLESYNHEEKDPDVDIIEYEQQLLHTDHAKVGRALLEKWGVPEAITVPVGLHHSVDQPKSKRLNAKIVYLANFLVNNTDLESAGEPGDFFFDVLAYEDHKENLPEVPNFGENMRNIIEEFVEKFNETVSVFEL